MLRSINSEDFAGGYAFDETKVAENSNLANLERQLANENKVQNEAATFRTNQV